MCGIFGSLTRQPNSSFDASFAAIKHRGPDASDVKGMTMGPWHVQLGHHRLSIIDLQSGQQPLIKNPWSIIFNGEIYNFRDLAARLPAQALRTHSDTEVILELFREVGSSAISLLDGFFGFGILNQDSRELWLARDRWGIKPLYYAQTADGGLLFGSELRPFMKSDLIDQSLDLAGLDRFLFWDHIPGEQTALRAVKKLRPGHVLHWKNGHVSIQPFYSPSILLTQNKISQTPDQVWQQITDSVDRSYISDVPVGILLSGGIDSSLIAVAAAEKQGRGIPTFSMGFKDPEFDESPFATAVAKQIGSDHHLQIIGEDELLDRWSDIVDGLDEPLGDPSLIPTRLLSELARKTVKVVLGGDGGDELFGGYPTYRAHALRAILDRVPPGMMGALQSVVSSLPTGTGYQPLGWKLKRIFNRYERDPVACHFRWMSGTDQPDVHHLSGRRTPMMATPFSLDLQDLTSFLWLDLTHYLPYSVLAKVDRASMAVGLEARPPFLTNSFVEYAMSIPVHQKVDGRGTKKILREVAQKRLPPQVVHRPKRGFAIPLSAWLRGPLAPAVESMVKDSPLWDECGYQRSALQTSWKGLQSGVMDSSKTIWSCLVLNRWLLSR